MLISILVEFLQKQLKHLKDSSKKSQLTTSGAPASSLPKCNYLEVMRFLLLHDKTGNKPTLCLPNDTSFFRKNRTMPELL